MEEFKLANYKQIELVKQGNKEVFSKLIEELKIKLYKTAISILKNDDDACDAIQETLISAYKNINSLKNNDYFSTWITRILINNCYEIIRKNKKVEYLNKQTEINEDIYYESYSQESDLEWVLNQLDNDLKTVTVFYYYDDFSVNEISEILNIPEGTVKSRLSRARDKLYKILKEKEGENIG